MGNALGSAVVFTADTRWISLVTSFARAVNRRKFDEDLDEIEKIVGRTITPSERTDSWNAVQQFAKCLRGFKRADTLVLTKAMIQFYQKKLAWPQGPQSTTPEAQQLRASIARIMSWSNANPASVYNKFDTEIYRPLDAITQRLQVSKFSGKQHLYKIWRMKVFAWHFVCALY